MIENSFSKQHIVTTEEAIFHPLNPLDKKVFPEDQTLELISSEDKLNLDFPAKETESIHIIFVIHGIGVSQASLLESEKKLIECLEKVKNFRRNMFTKCVEIKMLDWKSFLVEKMSHRIGEITLKNNESKRHLMNTVPADLLFYLSKNHSKKILVQIVKQANEIASQFSKYKDVRYSFLAHSLGSVIAYDLLEKNFKLKTEQTHKTSNKIRLAFDIDYIFNIGSPLGLFLTISHDQKIMPLDEMKFVKGIFNIYHPHDLFAYRLEPALSFMSKIKKPIHIPFYKNDGYKKHKESGTLLQIYCCPKKKNKNFNEENNVEINHKRYDFELQESFLEYCIETLGIIESHTSYWKNMDAIYFILRQIHNMGY